MSEFISSIIRCKLPPESKDIISKVKDPEVPSIDKQILIYENNCDPDTPSIRNHSIYQNISSKSNLNVTKKISIISEILNDIDYLSNDIKEINSFHSVLIFILHLILQRKDLTDELEKDDKIMIIFELFDILLKKFVQEGKMENNTRKKIIHNNILNDNISRIIDESLFILNLILKK